MEATDPGSLRGRYDDRGMTLAVDTTAWPIDSLYAACYWLVDRCFVFLTKSPDDVVSVRLIPRAEASPAEIEALARELAQRIADERVRQQIAADSRTLREYYTARALFVEPPRPSIDSILAELDSAALEEDPLEIRLPWDEKRKKDLSA